MPPWCERLVLVWAKLRRMRGGGMIPGAPVLLQAGGYGDQQALAMDAFEMFDHWAETRKGQQQ